MREGACACVGKWGIGCVCECLSSVIFGVRRRVGDSRSAVVV